jgi:hypothetical protein
MNKDKKKKIIIISSIVLVIVLGVIVYLLINLNNKIKDTIETNTLNYLTTEYVSEDYGLSYSPLIGLLNYSFDDISTFTESFGILDLEYTNFFYHSIMSENDINNLYKSVFGKSKSEMDNIYVESISNCYYNQKKLNKSLNCDLICSKSESEIMDEMRNKLNWINVSSEDVSNFCLKNVSYDENSIINKTIIDVNKLKSIFKEVTGKELNVPYEIINDNSLYKYNAYAVTNIKRLSEYIINIESVKYKSRIGKKYTLEYTAKTNMNREINGVVVLQDNDNSYYILSNSLETVLK